MAINSIVNRWYEMGQAERAEMLQRYPELAGRVSLSDPSDAAAVARDEERSRSAASSTKVQTTRANPPPPPG